MIKSISRKSLKAKGLLHLIEPEYLLCLDENRTTISLYSYFSLKEIPIIVRATIISAYLPHKLVYKLMSNCIHDYLNFNTMSDKSLKSMKLIISFLEGQISEKSYARYFLLDHGRDDIRELAFLVLNKIPFLVFEQMCVLLKKINLNEDLEVDQESLKKTTLLNKDSEIEQKMWYSVGWVLDEYEFNDWFYTLQNYKDLGNHISDIQAPHTYSINKARDHSIVLHFLHTKLGKDLDYSFNDNSNFNIILKQNLIFEEQPPYGEGELLQLVLDLKTIGYALYVTRNNLLENKETKVHDIRAYNIRIEKNCGIDMWNSEWLYKIGNFIINNTIL